MTPKLWGITILAVILLLIGWSTRSRVAAWWEFRNVKGQVTTLQNQGKKYDGLVTDNMRDQAAIDAGVSRAQTKNQEAARNAPSYRAYLDRPLPDASLQLYRNAAEAIAAAQRAGTDDAGAAADTEDR
jgi:hypothetical protein